jgi:hypothetical protein
LTIGNVPHFVVGVDASVELVDGAVSIGCDLGDEFDGLSLGVRR